MFALVYVSEVTSSISISKQELSDLVILASAKNRSLAVTGFLQYSEPQFFQYLEGEKSVVLDLMDTIDRDPRHTVKRIVHLPKVRSRQFENWHMRHVTNERFNAMDLISLLQMVLLEMDDSQADIGYYTKDRIMRLVTRLAKQHREYPRTFDL